MKKLMIAAAAAALVGGASALESANIVGYQNTSTKTGFTFVTPTFEAIGGGGVSLGDIVPADDGAGWGTETITTFDADLYVGGEYTYYCKDYGMAEGAGWYNDLGENCNDVTLEYGQGVQVQTDGMDIQFKGQVKVGNANGKIVIDNLQDGFTMVCNPTPNELDIQDFIPVGESVGWGTEAITTYDEDLYVELELTYYCEDYGMADGAGCYTDAGEKISLAVPAGWGFIIQTGGDCTLEVPAPVY